MMLVFQTIFPPSTVLKEALTAERGRQIMNLSAAGEKYHVEALFE